MRMQETRFQWVLRGAIFALLIFGPRMAAAACHVVTPSGSGAKNGSDWSNAYAGLPTTLVRGDSYYLAAGTYGQYAFTTPENGTTLITIKTATNSDNCTASGWSSSLAGQAVFSYLETNHGYVTFDGNGRTGLRSGYGMKVDRTTPCSSPVCWDFNVDNDWGHALSNVTIRYMELAGEGSANVESHNETAIRAVDYSTSPGTASGASNISVQYVWIHDTAGAPIMLRGAFGVLVEHNLIENNYGDASYHAEGISDSGSNNITVRYNEFKNVQNTAVISELNAGTVSVANSWSIYGNVFYETSSMIGNGPITCINGQICSNWVVYNNTFDGFSGNYSGFTVMLPSTATGTVANNLWWNSSANGLGTGAGLIEDYNTFLNSRGPALLGSHDVVASGQPNPFVSNSSDNWNLRGDTSTGLGAGQTLASPFNVDPNGVLRASDGTWDRGACQYSTASASSAPSPPLLLQAVVQ